MPNGKYRVFVNIDSPSGFWGEYQVYRKRAILAQGKPVVADTMDSTRFKKQVLPLLERRGPAGRQHLRQVPEGLLPGEDLRRGRDRRAAEHRVPGRELGVQRLGRGRLPGREGGRGRAVPQVRREQAAVLTSTTTSSASCTGRPATRCSPTPRTERRAATSSSRATA